MNTANKQPMSLTARVLIGMVLGIVTGLIVSNFLADIKLINDYLVHGLFDVGGKIFIASLKMLVVPLVFVSLVCGTSSLKDISTLGRLGGKTLGLYLATTAVAITIAIGMALLFQPGSGADLTAASSFQAKDAPSLGDVLIGMFPTNPIHAMAEGNTCRLLCLPYCLALQSAHRVSRANVLPISSMTSMKSL